jgi:cytochrome c oxidase subunit 4
MQHQIVPVRTYVLVWLALMILTAVTWQAALVNMGMFNIVVAVSIAMVKMTLVITIFMHARSAEPLTKLYVVAGFVWLAILLFFFMTDYFSRSWMPSGKLY